MRFFGQNPPGKVKNFSTIRRGAALLVLVAALVLLAWGYWPYDDQVNGVSLSPAEMLPADWRPAFSPPRCRALGRAPVRIILPACVARRRGGLGPSDPRSACKEDTIPGETSAGQPAQVAASAGEYSVIAGAGSICLASLLRLRGWPTRLCSLAGRSIFMGRPSRPTQVFEGVAWLHLNYLTADNRPDPRQVLTAQRIPDSLN